MTRLKIHYEHPRTPGYTLCGKYGYLMTKEWDRVNCQGCLKLKERLGK